MTISTSGLHSKMPRERGKSPGWAAFNLEQRQKQVLKPEFNSDPYPPIPSMRKSVPLSKNSVIKNPAAMSFLSVIQPSMDFPTLMDSKNSKRELLIGDSSRMVNNKFVNENGIISAHEKLKELHGWADDSLIQDILAAVDNDFHQASSLLKDMVFSSNSDENKATNHTELNTEKAYEGDILKNKVDLTELSSVLEDCLNDNKNKQAFGSPFENKLSDENRQVKMISGNLIPIPFEPEWEEDDVYLSHRKDAIRMIRIASQHSKGATNAFLRGDHLSAQHLSHKAREDWITAERINAKAAKEILRIRNGKNDLWKLDLHGLHAREAVLALQEHLQKIETQIILNRSISPNRAKPREGFLRSSSVESLSFLEAEATTNKQHELSRRRPTVLEVITGTGNHSKGQAALPAAVRSFLTEKGYRFDEARPGVITVRPKFRHH